MSQSHSEKAYVTSPIQSKGNDLCPGRHCIHPVTDWRCCGCGTKCSAGVKWLNFREVDEAESDYHRI